MTDIRQKLDWIRGFNADAVEIVDMLSDAESGATQAKLRLEGSLRRQNLAVDGELDRGQADDALAHLAAAGRELRAALRIAGLWMDETEGLARHTACELTGNGLIGVRARALFEDYARHATPAEPAPRLDPNHDRHLLFELDTAGLIKLSLDDLHPGHSFLEFTERGRRLAAAYDIAIATDAVPQAKS